MDHHPLIVSLRERISSMEDSLNEARYLLERLTALPAGEYASHTDVMRAIDEATSHETIDKDIADLSRWVRQAQATAIETIAPPTSGESPETGYQRAMDLLINRDFDDLEHRPLLGTFSAANESLNELQIGQFVMPEKASKAYGHYCRLLDYAREVKGWKPYHSPAEMVRTYLIPSAQRDPCYIPCDVKLTDEEGYTILAIRREDIADLFLYTLGRLRAM